MKKGVAFGPFDDQRPERQQILAVAQERRQHLFSALFAQWVET
jgi:hypothetical protein